MPGPFVYDRLMETDELAEYLEALQRDDCYRVVQVLKESDAETTELVMFVGRNGAQQGPFVRKTIERIDGAGAVYERIMAAQQSGKRFLHLPRIVECHAAGQNQIVVMEYVQGETLDQVVERCGASAALALDVMGQLCSAVAELHEGFDPPIIHRDIKPANIIVAQGSLTLIDFGIARTYCEGGSRDTTHFGTRPYAPPEQFGFAQTDARSDIYALGKMLEFCLTGKVEPALAHNGEGAQALQPFWSVIQRACALDPAARYGSVRELKDALARVGGAAQRGSSASGVPAGGFGHQNVMPFTPTGNPFATGVPAGSLPGLPASGFSQMGEMPDKGAEPQSAFSFGSAAPARVRELKALAARIPAWVGMVWDGVISACAALCVAGCTVAALAPNEADSALPLWFRVFEYGIAATWFLVCLYAVYDTRRLGKYFAWTAKLNVLSYGKRLIFVGVYLLVSVVVLTIVGMPVTRGL